jgi:hypothetical protein
MNTNISKKSATQELTGNTGKKAFYGAAKRLGGSLLTVAAGMMVLTVVFTTPAWTQDKPADDMQILRDRIKGDKRLLVSKNMELTASEGKAFWPIYEQYQKDLTASNQRILRLIKSYAEAYRASTLTEVTAKKLVDEFVAIEKAEAVLKESYVPKLSKAMPAKRVLRYLQIESKIRAVVMFELAREIPLMP